MVPGVGVGFLLMGVVRSVGDAMLARGDHAYGVWDSKGWNKATSFVGDTLGSSWLLGTVDLCAGVHMHA